MAGNDSGKKTRLQLVEKEFFFPSVSLAEVPHTRHGKHHEIVAEILHDLGKLKPRTALKIPRSAFGAERLANIRAALNRATRKAGILVGTSSDDDFLYVWKDTRGAKSR